MVFAFKTATLAPEFQVSMCPSPHLWFLQEKTVTFGAELQVSMGTRLLLLTCECKTACLEPE